jgi:propionyl-CoA carboxylase alpha chain/3-methylcrotonyl-CoA carboxylase alpha subunit/acetyl-CoA/propionyl-CoA carboxylase biotin carboxyl carrier protein
VPDLPGLRFDSGVERGQQITANFDPLLAKMIVHGPTRQAAIDAMQKALREIVLLGVVTNIDYLSRTVAHPAFQRGELHTGFLQDHAAALTTAPLTDDQKIAALLAAALSSEKLRFAFSPPEPYSAVAGWRN